MRAEDLSSRGLPTPVFLFSLPRSGSTLAQRILAAHADVATTSEPWVLLPHFYALRERGVYAEYNQSSLVSAVEDFCEALPGGRETYVSEVRKFALSLYGKASPEGSRYFLDKTPRYHLISGQIVDAFPDGKHVFLWRNPLSVVASLIETWGRGRWNVYRHKVDLFDGMEGLIETYQNNRASVHAVRYEDLLTDPETAWAGVFRYLDLPLDDRVWESFADVRLKGRKGDPVGTKAYAGLSREPLSRWRTVLASPVRRAWCRRYLAWLGRERLATMGYDLDDLLDDLRSLPPSYGGLGSDLWRSSYGLAYDLLEPKILRHKLGGLRDWKRVHPHK